MKLEKVVVNGGCGTDEACAYYGGAISVADADLFLVKTIIRDKTAKYRGGAIYASRSRINITDSTFSRNAALEDAGGAIYLEEGSELDAEGGMNSFEGNSASSAGKGHVL